MRRFLHVLVAAGLPVTACDSPTSPSVEQARYEALLAGTSFTLGAVRDSAFASELRPYRFQSGFWVAGSRVARSADVWSAVFDTLQAYRAPKVTAPDVDFQHEMVVLALYGSAASSGYVVRIRHATLVRDTVFVLAEHVRPGGNCGVLAVLTTPTDARVIPARASPVVTLFARYVTDCDSGKVRPEW